MARLIRLIVSTFAVYFFYRVAYPEGSGQAYHTVSTLMLMGGAVATFFVIKLIDAGSAIFEWGIEGAFLLIVFFYLGFSMPQTQKASPLIQLIHGEHPTRTTVETGFSKMGVNPNLAPVRFLINLFPA